MVIQSIGMTSATIYLLCRRTSIEYRMLWWGIAGAAFGLIFGTFYIVPQISDANVKLIFACLWASFGVLTLLKNRELCSFHDLPLIRHSEALVLGLGVGFVGGITTSLTGVGIDMMLYTVLVLLYRMDLKAAVPTSVVIMAVTSIVGSLLHFRLGDFSPEVFHYWLAASPVVILGAPLGAFLVSVVPRMATLYFVAVLCVLQFFWTLYEVPPTQSQQIFVAANLVIATVGFVLLYRLGKARAERQQPIHRRMHAVRSACVTSENV